MKVILLKDVPKIGHKMDIKDISDGYAINFLIPNKLAEAATPKHLAEIEKLKQRIQIERGVQEETLKKNLARLKSLELVMKAKANDTGHLFYGLSKDNILAKLDKDYQIDINPEFVMIEKPIKEIGEFTINIEAFGNKSSFKLIVGKE